MLLVHGLSHHGVATVADALAKLGVADGIKLGASHEVVLHGVGSAEHLVVLAHDLRLVQAFGKRASLFELDEELLAGIAGCLSDSEA